VVSAHALIIHCLVLGSIPLALVGPREQIQHLLVPISKSFHFPIEFFLRLIELGLVEVMMLWACLVDKSSRASHIVRQAQKLHLSRRGLDEPGYRTRGRVTIEYQDVLAHCLRNEWSAAHPYT